jgi:hypothetical protein
MVLGDHVVGATSAHFIPLPGLLTPITGLKLWPLGFPSQASRERTLAIVLSMRASHADVVVFVGESVRS